jgi:glycosyltransferase involved in cell wall biosynthesis
MVYREDKETKAGGMSMKIAMVLSTPLPPGEGVGIYVWNLSQWLRRQGHDVLLITRGGHALPASEEIDGFTVLRPAYFPLYPMHVRLHEIFVNRVVKALEEDIDLFHIHSPLPPVIKTRRPVMITFHSSVHDDLRAVNVNSIYELMLRLQEPISYRHENRLLKAAGRVTVVSPYMREVIARYPHANDSIDVTWNGVDTQLFSPNGKQHQGYVLTTGRLAAVKGLHDLIRAAKIVNQKCGPTQFKIVGDGPLRSQLEREIGAQGLQGQVELVGHVSDRNQLADLYRHASLFVSPSHKEGMPTVMLEAMATGCPVVVTAVCANPDVITHEKDGILTPPHQPEALAGAIIAALSDPDRLAVIGAAGRDTVQSRFSWDAISQLYIDQYEQLLAGAAA